MGTQCLEGYVSRRCWHNRHQPALAGDIEWIEPQELARSPHFCPYRDRTFVDHHGDIGGCSDLIQDSGYTASGGIPQAMDSGSGIEQARHQVGQRRSIRHNVRHHVRFPAG